MRNIVDATGDTLEVRERRPNILLYMQELRNVSFAQGGLVKKGTKLIEFIYRGSERNLLIGKAECI